MYKIGLFLFTAHFSINDHIRNCSELPRCLVLSKWMFIKNHFRMLGSELSPIFFINILHFVTDGNPQNAKKMPYTLNCKAFFRHCISTPNKRTQFEYLIHP